MRTRMTGRYVVGYDGGHRIIAGGEVVYDDDRIVFVGRGYTGQVDRTIDASDCLVSPGFVNLHAVTNVDLQVFRIDVDSPGFPKSRAWVESEGPEVLDEAATEASVRFSVACLIRGGATTFGAITTMASKRWEDPAYEPELIAEVAGQMGARAGARHRLCAAHRRDLRGPHSRVCVSVHVGRLDAGPPPGRQGGRGRARHTHADPLCAE